MSVFDGCLKLLPQPADLRVTYNKKHIALGTRKQNFSWFTPRKQQRHCYVRVRVGEI
jgi:hypothetical protein